MFKSLTAPQRLIADNAGTEGEVVVEKVSKMPWEGGYNAMYDRYEDLLVSGVIDPAKVTRSALQNSCSIAGMLLTTQAVMVEKKTPSKRAGAGQGGMGGFANGLPSGMSV